MKRCTHCAAELRFVTSFHHVLSRIALNEAGGVLCRLVCCRVGSCNEHTATTANQTQRQHLERGAKGSSLLSEPNQDQKSKRWQAQILHASSSTRTHARTRTRSHAHTHTHTHAHTHTRTRTRTRSLSLSRPLLDLTRWHYLLHRRQPVFDIGISNGHGSLEFAKQFRRL